jgi:hypothetical protein
MMIVFHYNRNLPQDLHANLMMGFREGHSDVCTKAFVENNYTAVCHVDTRSLEGMIPLDVLDEGDLRRHEDIIIAIATIRFLGQCGYGRFANKSLFRQFLNRYHAVIQGAIEQSPRPFSSYEVAE